MVAAAIVAVAWLIVLAAVRVARRPPHIDAGPLAQEPPREPPAIAGLLCDDFELASELPPATLLDLAARRIVRLEEVQPGKTICRVRQAPDERVLAAYEQRVLDELGRKAVDGVVPADALTTGMEAASRSWQREFGKEVVADVQAAGLTRDRWPNQLASALFVGRLSPDCSGCSRSS